MAPLLAGAYLLELFVPMPLVVVMGCLIGFTCKKIIHMALMGEIALMDEISLPGLEPSDALHIIDLHLAIDLSYLWMLLKSVGAGFFAFVMMDIGVSPYTVALLSILLRVGLTNAVKKALAALV